jgi:hypothetical protein
LRKEEAMRDLLRLATMIAIGSAAAQAQDVNDAPFNEKWSPTEWGADDKVGAPNRTTPELVLKAVGLVKQERLPRSVKSMPPMRRRLGPVAGS